MTKCRLIGPATQNNLGIALKILGERESETTRLKEAVTTFRSALEERTRNKVPLDWAASQNDLGATLQALGLRERETAYLEESVNILREALEEFSQVKARHLFGPRRKTTSAMLFVL